MNNGIFGIDLGTTYSCIAYVDEFGKAVTIRNADGEMTTPSVVYFEDTEKQIVGTEAKTSMVMEPENTVAKSLYASFGFVETGEKDGEELEGGTAGGAALLRFPTGQGGLSVIVSYRSGRRPTWKIPYPSRRNTLR